MSNPITVIATYRVRKAEEDAFRALLKKHWPTLREHDLATDEPPLIFRGEDEGQEPFFVEIFRWRDEAAKDTAHQLPEIMAIWEPMGKHCTERAGRPSMEFPHVERLELHKNR
jgi:quinol monooxygenase YgiN